MSRALLLPLLLALFGAVADAAQLGKGARVSVPLRELRPSQMEVGRSEVDATVKKWKRKALSQGMSLRRYAEKRLTPKFAHLGVEAVVDPHGNVRPTDGHHRISALLEVEKRTGVSVPVQVKIAKDYRGMSDAAFAQDFVVARGKGYFTRGVMRLDPVDRVAHLPVDFAHLRNSPMRSAMAQLFTKLDLDDDKLVDYAEFKVADYLIDHHVFKSLAQAGLVARGTSHLPQALAHDPRALEVMREALDTDEGKAFLSQLSRKKPLAASAR